MTSLSNQDDMRVPPEERLDRLAVQSLRRGFLADSARLNSLPDAPRARKRGTAAFRPLALVEPSLTDSSVVVEFTNESRRLDPRRAIMEPDAPLPTSGQKRSILGTISSLAFHLLPFLLLFDWSWAPVSAPPPIPVALVIEKPPPKPPAPPAEKPPPPHHNLASEEMGQTGPQKPEAATPPPQPAPPETQVAAVTPPRKPELESALPTPAPTSDAAALPEVEKPGPQYKDPVPHPVIARLPPRHEASPHIGRTPGPDATRDEYLAYCNSLIRQHFDMLPPTFIGGRSGLTVLSIIILDNGAIGHIALLRSSGYSDIDSRVERMVATVGHFPPLPQWFQGSAMAVSYELPFPAALVR